MILVLVLGFFLTLTYYVTDTLQSTNSTREIYEKVYLKEKHYIILDSLISKITILLQREERGYDALTDPWAKPYIFETHLGTISVEIVDEDRFLNPNYITKIRGLREVFEKLFRFLEVDLELLNRILVWTGQEQGFIDLELPLKRKPMDSVHEIELFWNKKEDLYGKEKDFEKKPGLLELLTVFSDGKVNINTAPVHIIFALDKDIDWDLAKRIADYRRDKPFRRIRDLLLVKGVTLDIAYRLESKIKVRSRFFRVKMSIKTDKVETTLTFIYDRDRNKILYKELE
ncbi:MAG TPA: general secretion pathway protein GspK [Aquifex aeolicus]|nr:general secretion pathway protein GspK [Aquifex aeolicus]